MMKVSPNFILDANDMLGPLLRVTMVSPPSHSSMV